MLLVTVLVVGVAGASPESSFRQLDAEAEKVLVEALELGAEVAGLEASAAVSSRHLLEVVVSLAPDPQVRIEAVRLQLDGEIARDHRYSDKERDALKRGGAHPLFRGELPAGRHRLVATLFARVPRQADFQRQVSLDFVSGGGPRVVELRLAPGPAAENGKPRNPPEFTLKEWK